LLFVAPDIQTLHTNNIVFLGRKLAVVVNIFELVTNGEVEYWWVYTGVRELT